jgi:hypothetical protein
LYKFRVYNDVNKNKKQKRLKTENMKTTMKELAAGTFIALLLLVGNVKAEGTETKASSHESIESTLQLENWMIDEAIWNSNSLNISEFVQETETGMDLETWMTSSETWNFNTNFVEETEAGMEVESWMTSEDIWNLSKINNETELTVENWMTDSNIWK